MISKVPTYNLAQMTESFLDRNCRRKSLRERVYRRMMNKRIGISDSGYILTLLGVAAVVVIVANPRIVEESIGAIKNVYHLLRGEYSKD